MTEQEYKIEVLQKCKENLTFFGKTISPSTYYLDSPPFHAELDALLTDKKQVQTMIEAPRGTSKSTKAIDAIIDHITFDKGDKVVVIQSKTRGEAMKRLGKIKNILEYSPQYRDLFGYAGEQAAYTWQQDRIKTKIDGDWVTIVSIGTGQQMRGILEGDTRITLLLLDDPDDENSCITKEQMEKNFDRFLGGVAGLDRRNGRVIVIGTPIRMGCIVDKLRDAPGWATKRYQSYDEETLDPLWADMYSYEWLMTKKSELKAVGKLSKFYSEYMCQIVGDEDQLFKEEYLQYWDGYVSLEGEESFLHITHRGLIRDKDNNNVPRELEEEIVKPVNICIGVDPASSTKRTADYSVTMPIAYDGRNIYVLPYFRKRVTPTAHADQIIQLIKDLRPSRGHIETVGYQEMLRDYLRNRLMEEDLYLPGLEKKFNPRTEKSERLETMHPFFYNRRVWVQPNMTEFLDELSVYPRGKHDDCIKEDALIKTIDGYKEVKDITNGDLVLTHKGNYKKVTKVIEKDFDGQFCTLKPNGQLPLEVSTDHKIRYASKVYSKDKIEQYYPGYEKRGWIEADSFKKTYKNIFIAEHLKENQNFVYKLPKSKYSNNEKLNELILDKDFAKVLGYFLAEGNAYQGKGQSRRFAISFASHTREVGKRAFLKKYFSKWGISVKENIDGNSAAIIFDNKFFHYLFLQCYDKAKEKIFPPYSKPLGKDLKHSLVWWMAGDGWVIKRKTLLDGRVLKPADRYCGSTSKKLVLSMRDIAFSMGYYASIRTLKRHRYGKPTKDFHQMDLYFNQPNFSKITKLSDFEYGSGTKVKDIQSYNGKVYDLQVEDDHSFVCNGFVIHNCLDGFYYATRKLISPDHLVAVQRDESDLRHFLIPDKVSGWQTR